MTEATSASTFVRVVGDRAGGIGISEQLAMTKKISCGRAGVSGFVYVFLNALR